MPRQFYQRRLYIAANKDYLTKDKLYLDMCAAS